MSMVNLSALLILIKFNVMKRLFFSVACALALTMGVSSCGVLGSGMLYNDTVEPTQVTANSLGSKVGEATIVNYLGAVALGDAGIQTPRIRPPITLKELVSISGVFMEASLSPSTASSAR